MLGFSNPVSIGFPPLYVNLRSVHVVTYSADVLDWH